MQAFDLHRKYNSKFDRNFDLHRKYNCNFFSVTSS